MFLKKGGVIPGIPRAITICINLFWKDLFLNYYSLFLSYVYRCVLIECTSLVSREARGGQQIPWS